MSHHQINAGNFAFTMLSSRSAVQAPKAPKPKGNYSQAIRCGNTLYVSGCMGDDLNGEIASGDVRAQAARDLVVNRAITNIKAILEHQGSSLDKVLSRKIYLVKMKDLELVDRIWGRYLRPPYPASTCIQVTGLAREDALVAIEVVAEI